jgi:hypothetical protein
VVYLPQMQQVFLPLSTTWATLRTSLHSNPSRPPCEIKLPLQEITHLIFSLDTPALKYTSSSLASFTLEYKPRVRRSHPTPRFLIDKNKIYLNVYVSHLLTPAMPSVSLT